MSLLDAEEQPPDPDVAGAVAARPGHRRRRPVIRAAVTAGAAMAVVAAVVTAVIEWPSAGSAGTEVAVRDDISTTAAAEGAALFSYDYRDLAAAQRRVLALASGPFAQREAAHDAAVSAKLAHLRATSTATVREVAVTGDAGGRAGAFVVVESQTQAGGPPTAVAHYLNMTLTLQSGRWKVDAVQSLLPPPG
jgi:hypothetical protein